MSAPPGSPAASKTVGLANTFQVFQDLMPFHVQNILLVSSLYDSFILQQDGQLNEQVITEFLELNLRHTPDLTHVSTGAEALRLAQSDRRNNLIVTTINVGDMDAAELAAAVRAAGLDIPVCVLAYDASELQHFLNRHPASAVDRIFMWQGNARILLAMAKYIEDRANAPHDTAAGVRVVIVVEDNIRYYSAFLPTIYAELIAHSQNVISEGMNLAHKLVRMRARPKILLCTSYEEAWQYVQQYQANLLGLISDIHFPMGGKPEPDAGYLLAQRVRELMPDLPVLLQSSRAECRERAWEAGASFVLKGSPTLLADLRRFMTERFAFGDFVFRMEDGQEVGRAHDLRSLEHLLGTVPAESVGYHAERNHFSNWLIARTEFELAFRLRPRGVEDFPDLEAVRRDLMEAVAEYRRYQGAGVVEDFRRSTFTAGRSFCRVGSGSLGGKARGLAFVRHLLNTTGLAERFPGVRIAVPPSAVVATDVFEQFLEDNDLLDFALQCRDEDRLRRRFLRADFPAAVREDLSVYLEAARYPLAVRSSSLLEDSQYQPFTGVYDTLMLPNNHPRVKDRLEQLIWAIKRVYASTFYRHAKHYLGATAYRLEEERMGILLQRVVGSSHGSRFYPDFAGVARSHNFYPVAPLKAADGIAAVALGLGRTVVDGEKSLSFCPRYPRNLLHFSSVRDILGNSQREFWALDLGARARSEAPEAWMRGRCYDLAQAEVDGTLGPVASTYSPANDAIYDGLSRPGVRLVTFAPVLKHDAFPLAEILDSLLGTCSEAMGRPVELEFAVRLRRHKGRHVFGFVQLRPLALARETEAFDIGDVDASELIVHSEQVLGNGRVDDLYDAVVVDFRRFDRSRSREAAAEVARCNARLTTAGRPYLLVGVGRWGSTDPWLGLPVTWSQISGARVIVETGFKDLRVTPSQGSHFFQNLAEFQVGYFTVNPGEGEGFIDWDWLGAQPASSDVAAVRQLRFERPMTVKMDGRDGRGVVYKPGGATIQ